MPYSSISEIPDYVQGKLKTEKRKRQWLHIFNSVYAQMRDKGLNHKEAEQRAFAAANSILSKSLIEKAVDMLVSMATMGLLKDFDDKSQLGPKLEEPEESGVDVSDILDKLHYRDEKPMQAVSRDVVVKSLSVDEGLVYGVVYEPYVVDAHGHFTTPDEIEKAAHEFLPNAALNIHHQQDISELEAVVVESYIAPTDFTINGQQIRKGSWVIVTKVNNEELKKAIANGEITGYSLEGVGTLLEVEQED